jgi:hypothetical protein
LRKFAQLSSADAVYMANRGTTYNRKVSAPTLGVLTEPVFWQKSPAGSGQQTAKTWFGLEK